MADAPRPIAGIDPAAAVTQIESQVKAGQRATAKQSILALLDTLDTLADPTPDTIGSLTSTLDFTGLLGYEAIGVELEAIYAQL